MRNIKMVDGELCLKKKMEESWTRIAISATTADEAALWDDRRALYWMEQKFHSMWLAQRNIIRL